MPRRVTPDGLMLNNSPHTFSFCVCKLMTMIEWGSMAERILSLAYRSLGGHGNRTSGGKQKFWLGERLHVFEGDAGRQFAQEEARGRNFDDGEFGDDVMHDFNAGERQRAFFQD